MKNNEKRMRMKAGSVLENTKKKRLEKKRRSEMKPDRPGIFQIKILIGMLCLFLLIQINGKLQMKLKAEEYPSECHLIIRTEEDDCSEEILLLYQIGLEYDPIREQICWAPYLDERQIQQMMDEREIPALITELERTLKKEEPLAILDLEEKGMAEQIVPSGVYLLIQESPRKVLIQSSMVSVPFMNEEGDGWIGEREIILKTAPVPEESQPRTPDTGDKTQPGILLASVLLSAAMIALLSRQYRNKC